MYPIEVGAQTKKEVLILVSVIAMGSGRAVCFSCCGIGYQRFSCFTLVVEPCVVLGCIAMLAWLCSTMTDCVMKLRGDVSV